MTHRLFTLHIVCFLLLASCTGDPERHELTPVEKPIVLYADQTVDSLLFYTFDSWSVTPQADWIDIDGDTHGNISYDYTKRYLCKVIVRIKPNTTGETRYGTVLVKSYDYDYLAPFVQLGMMRITHPQFTPKTMLDEASGIPQAVSFELTDSAHWTSDSICFTVHDNWDIIYIGENPDWLLPDKTSGLPGRHKVNLTLTPCTDTDKGRDATLRLVCGEVTNDIVVHQLPAKKTE